MKGVGGQSSADLAVFSPSLIMPWSSFYSRPGPHPSCSTKCRISSRPPSNLLLSLSTHMYVRTAIILSRFRNSLENIRCDVRSIVEKTFRMAAQIEQLSSSDPFFFSLRDFLQALKAHLSRSCSNYTISERQEVDSGGGERFGSTECSSTGAGRLFLRRCYDVQVGGMLQNIRDIRHATCESRRR